MSGPVTRSPRNIGFVSSCSLGNTAMLCCVPWSLLSKWIVTFCPAGIWMQPVSKATPSAVTVSSPFSAVVHCSVPLPLGWAVGWAPPVGVGLLIANASPCTSPYAPSIRFCPVSSYHATYTSPPGPTASVGRSPPTVPPVSIGEKLDPSPDARRTSSLAGSYHVT